ncbi:MAG TPA: RDD family protein, partial [bacterium]|nr:RDD family protein [bacterium]
MNETTRLPTPDNVELEFRLAGPGSRILALFIDGLISGGLYAALIIVLVVSGYSFSGEDSASSWVMVLVLFAFFLIRWGYYLFFEIKLRGQTPGKRALGIRVVRQGGLPLGIRHSLIRNLLRVVDSFPQPLCIVGGVSVLATRKGQRLGDLAAGTVVIRERFRARKDAATGSTQSAAWVSRLEQGLS